MGRQSHHAIDRILKIGRMTHDEAIAFMKAERKPALRWKPMDVAYGDNIHKPRRLVLEVNPEYPHHCYTTCSENDGIGSQSDYSLRTREEWLAWVDRFSDDLTGRELREAKEAVLADFVEPQSWTDFRKRFAETGDPWLRENNRPQPGSVPPAHNCKAQIATGPAGTTLPNAKLRDAGESGVE